MKILRVLSAGIIATGLAGAAQAAPLTYSFNSDDYAPFSDANDSFSVDFESAGNTFYLLTYGFSGGTQADGTAVSAGGFDSKLSIFNTAFSTINGYEDGSTPGCIQNAVNAAISYGGAATSTSHANAADNDTADDCLEIQVGAGVFELELTAENGFFAFGDYDTSWAFDIIGVEFAATDIPTEVPAPGLLGLFGLMLAGVSARGAKRLAAR